MTRLWAIGSLVNCILRWAECMGLFLDQEFEISFLPHAASHSSGTMGLPNGSRSSTETQPGGDGHPPSQFNRAQAQVAPMRFTSEPNRHELQASRTANHCGGMSVLGGFVASFVVSLSPQLIPTCCPNVLKTLPRSWMWNDVRNQICRANGDHEAVSVAAPHVSSIVAAQEYVAQRLATRKPTERLGEHVEQLRLFSKESFMFLHSTSNTWISRGFSCCCSALQTWSLVLRSSLLALTPGSTSRKSDDGAYGDQPASAWRRFIPICSQYWKSSNCAASVCFIWPSVVQMSFDLTEYMCRVAQYSPATFRWTFGVVECHQCCGTTPEHWSPETAAGGALHESQSTAIHSGLIGFNYRRIPYNSIQFLLYYVTIVYYVL